MKKAAFVLIAVLAGALCLEAVSAVLLAVATPGTDEVRARLLERADRMDDEPARPVLVRAGRSRKQGYIAHPYVGFVYDPRDSQAVNGHGFIGADLLGHTAATDFNVVVAGGSVAGNFFAVSWDALRQAVAGLPMARGRTVNVFCLAIPGYKQPQQLLAVNYFLARGAKIDLLLNIDGFNDVVMPARENLPAGLSPAYPMFWGELTDDFADAQARGLLGRLALWDGLGQAWARGCAPAAFSRTVAALWYLGDAVLTSQERVVLARLRQRTEAARPLPAGGECTEPEAVVTEQAADIWLRSSLLLAALARNGGFTYVHVLQPNQYPDGAKPMSAEERALAFSKDPSFGAAVRRGYEALARRGPALQQAGVIFEDATRLFADRNEALYLDSCCHFNETGNALLVGRIAALLTGLPAP
ncbi:hypothetical protein [Solidesulfovibrio sp.]